MKKILGKMRKITLAIAVLSLLIVSVIYTSAQVYGDKTGLDSVFENDQPRSEGFFSRFKERGMVKGTLDKIANRLNLTDEQKAEIRQIIENEIPVAKPILLSGLAIHQQLKPLGRDGVYNAPEVQRLATAQSQNAKLLIVEKEKVKARIFAVLTPEQRAEAEKMSEEIEAKVREKISEKLDMKF
jgi:Spy/CpxP family protein refolding chaperone